MRLVVPLVVVLASCGGANAPGAPPGSVDAGADLAPADMGAEVPAVIRSGVSHPKTEGSGPDQLAYVGQQFEDSTRTIRSFMEAISTTYGKKATMRYRLASLDFALTDLRLDGQPAVLSDICSGPLRAALYSSENGGIFYALGALALPQAGEVMTVPLDPGVWFGDPALGGHGLGNVDIRLACVSTLAPNRAIYAAWATSLSLEARPL